MKKMLSFTGSLNPKSDAFAIFVSESYTYKNKNNILSKAIIEKIDSFLKIIKEEKRKDEINYFDISGKQKCFIIKV